ncbi:NADH-quinone oxidoreductase subunit C [Paenibacillus senegalensis]|uniref:NADH-quinone oxidoreductase subunit C n=1 Tax=Paenibacillus senegalensis TaxID=1465766 RepID=UPI00028999F5|nr:NADH-quinone oxidoreductase subunit C [Paenibacillus senegalensis]
MSEEKKELAKQPEADPADEQSAKKESQESSPQAAPSDQAVLDKEAKRKAALEARAARAAQKAKKEEEPEEPKLPSPMQPVLDRAVQLIQTEVSEEAVAEAFINEIDGHRPYLVIKQEFWPETAKLLKEHPEFGLTYLRNLSGVDQETHLEVVYHLISMESKQNYCIKVKTDRDQPRVPSVTSVWETANWNEREVYDLLGIDFPGHPDLRRIMMPDDWVGHPLRKDYEPLDPEV